VNRSKLADLSEILSSIVIVATLVYLAVEITQNTKALEAQTSQAVMESAQEELFVLLEHPEVTIALGSDEPMNELDHIRLDNFLTASLRSREFAWLLYEDGAIGQEQWNTEIAVLVTIMDPKKTRLWWRNLGSQYFSPEFVKFVNSVLDQHEGTDSIWRKSKNWSEPEIGN